MSHTALLNIILLLDMFNYYDVVLGLSSLVWTSGVPILLLGTLQLIKWRVIFAQFGNDIVCSYVLDSTIVQPEHVISTSVVQFDDLTEMMLR